MLVSFIITARDEDPAVLRATVAGLEATTRHVPSETIVVDDGSREPVECRGRALRVVRNTRPAGVSPARSLGARLAAGTVLVWLDAHMSFGDSWLEQMLVHSAGGALLCSPFWTYDLSDCMCWGARFLWNSRRAWSEQKYPGFGFSHCTEPPGELAPEVPMVIGACYMMERSSYERMGGFSPHFRVWGVDEQDMSARAWLSGAGVRCATLAKVGHLYRSTFPYPVHFEHLEFNQWVMLKSVFEEHTLRRLEGCFRPLPAKVSEWLEAVDLSAWRATVQSARTMSDSTFFARFVPELAAEPTEGGAWH